MHIRDTDLNALGIDVRQNWSVMSYDKSNNFYKGEWRHCVEKGAFDGTFRLKKMETVIDRNIALEDTSQTGKGHNAQCSDESRTLCHSQE